MSRDADFTTSGRRLVYLAAERTLLSWIRTALAIMALGFVLDRLDVFLRSMHISTMNANPSASRDWMGTPIVFIGALMATVAAVRYLLFARRYRREGSTEPGHGLLLASVFALLVAGLGSAVAFFLLTVGH